MTTIQIRKATLNDISVLQKISIQTFTETFAAVNTPENINSYITEKLNIEQLSKELKHPSSEFFIAILNDEVVGYLKLNSGEAQTEPQDYNALEIHRIYVLQTYHGKNIGQQLLDFALQMGHHKQASYIWLGVWEENHRALKFYKKNGFIEFDKHIFLMGDDQQTDLLMQLKLK
jgi:ribosomal protein S18 acetylase RimI-like enzyme